MSELDTVWVTPVAVTKEETRATHRPTTKITRKKIIIYKMMTNSDETITRSHTHGVGLGSGVFIRFILPAQLAVKMSTCSKHTVYKAVSTNRSSIVSALSPLSLLARSVSRAELWP